MVTLRAVQRQIRTLLTYSLNVVGFRMLNLLPRFLEWQLILKLKF